MELFVRSTLSDDWQTNLLKIIGRNVRFNSKDLQINANNPCQFLSISRNDRLISILIKIQIILVIYKLLRNKITKKLLAISTKLPN